MRCDTQPNIHDGYFHDNFVIHANVIDNIVHVPHNVIIDKIYAHNHVGNN